MTDQAPQEPTQPLTPGGGQSPTEPISTTSSPSPIPPPRIPGGSGGGWAEAAMLLGGLLLVVGPLLAWLSLSARVRRPQAARLLGGRGTTGVHLADGRMVLALGVAVLALGALALMGRSEGLRTTISVLVLFAGVVAATVAATNLALPAQIPGLAEASALLTRGGARGATFAYRVGVSKGPGLWVTLAGGLVAVLAAGTGMASMLRRPGPPAGVR